MVICGETWNCGRGVGVGEVVGNVRDDVVSDGVKVVVSVNVDVEGQVLRDLWEGTPRDCV